MASKMANIGFSMTRESIIKVNSPFCRTTAAPWEQKQLYKLNCHQYRKMGGNRKVDRLKD